MVGSVVPELTCAVQHHPTGGLCLLACFPGELWTSSDPPLPSAHTTGTGKGAAMAGDVKTQLMATLPWWGSAQGPARWLDEGTLSASGGLLHRRALGKPRVPWSALSRAPSPPGPPSRPRPGGR